MRFSLKGLTDPTMKEWQRISKNFPKSHCLFDVQELKYVRISVRLSKISIPE